MKRDLHFEMTYPYAPEHVWKALTSAEAMAIWLMPNDFLPIIGHRFTFRTKRAPGFDGVVRCEVLEVSPPERLVYTWTGGGVDTKLVWTLKPIPEGTLLSLDHAGFKGLRGMLVSNILGKGWRSRILAVNLPALLRRWDGIGQIASIAGADCHKSH